MQSGVITFSKKSKHYLNTHSFVVSSAMGSEVPSSMSIALIDASDEKQITELQDELNLTPSFFEEIIYNNKGNQNKLLCLTNNDEIKALLLLQDAPRNLLPSSKNANNREEAKRNILECTAYYLTDSDCLFHGLAMRERIGMDAATPVVIHISDHDSALQQSVLENHGSLVGKLEPSQQSISKDFNPRIITNNQTYTIILVGRPNPNMIAHIRSLSRVSQDIHCIIVRGEPVEMIAKSNRIAQVYDLTTDDSPKFAHVVDSILNSTSNIVNLFIANESDYEVVSRLNSEQLKKIRMVSNVDAISPYLSKEAQNLVAQRAGIDVPQSATISDEESLKRASKSIEFPVICRPESSDTRGGFEWKYLISNTPEDLLTSLTAIIQKGDCSLLCQTYVPGSDSNLYFVEMTIDNNHTCYSYLAGHKIRQYPDGLMSSGRTINSQELISKTASFCELMRASGIFGLEFKKSSRNGKFYFIEANLRAENIVDITRTAQSDMVLHAFFIANNLDGRYQPCAPDDSVWIDVSADFMAIMKSKTNFLEKCKNLWFMLTNTNKDCALEINDLRPGLIWHWHKARSLLAKRN